MNIQDYLVKKQTIQKNLIEFIDKSTNIEENYQNLIIQFKDQKLLEHKNSIKELLLLILEISNNHFRTPRFFNKIERIISEMKEEIQENFSSNEIFKLFQSNKRIILYLIEEKIIKIDTSIVNIMNNDENKKFCYFEYFYLEVKPFLNNRIKIEIESKNNELKENNLDSFKEKRNLGENDDYISHMIRNDLIDEFISFVNQKNYFLSSTIKPSIYETNLYLIKNNPTLIEYSAFFGSIQIFKYIFLNQKKFTPSLLVYAIHGDNPEIIHLLEQVKIKNANDLYKQCFLESVKCHHNEIANYIQNNFMKDPQNGFDVASKKALKYRNYFYFQNDFINEKTFFLLCKYNYIELVEILLKSINFNINLKVIQTQFFFNHILNFLLLNEDVFINVINKTALYIAAEKGNFEIVKLLLSLPEIDINIKSIKTINILNTIKYI